MLDAVLKLLVHVSVDTSNKQSGLVSRCYAMRGRKGFASCDASKAALIATMCNLADEEAGHASDEASYITGATIMVDGGAP